MPARLVLIYYFDLPARFIYRPQYSAMNKTEEIVREYDRKRSIVHRLRYAVHISLLLMFYTYFRFATDRPSIPTFCFYCGFLTVLVSKVFLFSLYGIGSIRRGKELPVLKWKIIAVGVLIVLLLVEAFAFFTSDSSTV
jgi:hypothetical protein